ncbi:hypothetical protein PFISCL1PPCAC_26877 [Pristionchus fissidentatus]|uniref:F-box domain-containing protein n=1 Tax=Pristionchus fissidentatus TaxID=1538716 RepID=A0AAV5WY56_9BILA|nr:hypothetical protein PFISCL1PPCAC_26877 [Pristionchus fissidentatus]
MISVTVAAQGKKQRVVGGHLKAYGSGRLSIFDLDKAAEGKAKGREINIWGRAFTKLVDVVYSFLVLCFPFVFNYLNSPSEINDDEGNLGLIKKRNKREMSVVKYSAIQVVDESTLSHIFSYLNPIDIVECELVCKKWRRVVDENIEDLPKIQKDQIRILFDEGEVVVYPVDEKKCPRRYPMPSLQILARKLRHLRSLSLFVRGLIPVESTPVLKALCDLSLAPQQIYLIWCKFSSASAPHLAEFLHRNVSSLTDLGLEECNPPSLVTDSLLLPLLSSLTSLRVWNDGKSGSFALSDATVLALADSIRAGDGGLETVDLACCAISSTGVVALIECWVEGGTSDLSLSLTHCPLLTLDSLLSILESKEIYFKNGKIARRGHCLSLFV